MTLLERNQIDLFFFWYFQNELCWNDHENYQFAIDIAFDEYLAFETQFEVLPPGSEYVWRHWNAIRFIFFDIFKMNFVEKTATFHKISFWFHWNYFSAVETQFKVLILDSNYADVITENPMLKNRLKFTKVCKFFTWTLLKKRTRTQSECLDLLWNNHIIVKTPK